MENEVLKAIKERRSIRRFKADQITDEELKTVLEAGTWAATGHGTQEPFIIAVQNPEICAQLRKMNADLRPASQDERRNHGCRKRSLLWSANHRYRSSTRKQR